MKHSIDYYIEHIEPMIDNLNRQHSMNIEYEIIGDTIPFDKSAEMYNRSTYIGPADDGWSEIVKIDDKYYMVQQGLQEYEGHVYMSQVKIISIEILN